MRLDVIGSKLRKIGEVILVWLIFFCPVVHVSMGIGKNVPWSVLRKVKIFRCFGGCSLLGRIHCSTWPNMAQKLRYADSEVKLETQGMQGSAHCHWIVCQHSGHCALQVLYYFYARYHKSNFSDSSFSLLAVPCSPLQGSQSRCHENNRRTLPIRWSFYRGETCKTTGWLTLILSEDYIWSTWPHRTQASKRKRSKAF